MKASSQGDDWRCLPEEEIRPKFHNSYLRANLMQVVSMARMSAYSRLRNSSRKLCPNDCFSRGLNDVYEASKANSNCDTHDKVVNPHHESDDDDGAVLQAVQSTVSGYESFSRQVDAKHVDQCSNHHNWNIAYDLSW